MGLTWRCLDLRHTPALGRGERPTDVGKLTAAFAAEMAVRLAGPPILTGGEPQTPELPDRLANLYELVKGLGGV